MFIGTLKDAERCFPLHPGLKTLFDFVAANDFDALPLGRIEIDGDNIYAVNVDNGSVSRERQPLEMHRKYIDVHIALEDGEIYADEVAYVKENKKEIGVEIHSGRNRIVRRMFEHLGYTVQKLDRVYYAGLTKKNLKRGAWRFLTREEVMRLKTGQYE